jgi:chemotaxis protein histidine kinase CheA
MDAIWRALQPLDENWIVMSSNMNDFQALLDKMREEFLGELPEKCDHLDDLILVLEKNPDDRDAFNELYRGVHSLKGSGGTHGLSIITTICHQLETLLTETDIKGNFGTEFARQSLACIDLLRKVVDYARQEKPNYATIEAGLESLRDAGLQDRRTGLIAESSPVMSNLYQQALERLPLQLTVVGNGLAALERLIHEPFDLVIVGREVKDLNGIAMMAALRASLARNSNIPSILVSSTQGSVPDHAGFSVIISRDKNLADNLVAAVKSLLKV